jgi:acyl-CoA thioester hydrolase
MQDVYENRARFAETDQQGIVFYGEYVTFQDEAFNGYLRAIDYGYDEMLADGWDIHVVNLELDFRAPARFGDVIHHGFRVERIGDSSFRSRSRARLEDGTVLAEGTVTHVAVDEDGETIRVPAAFREAVRAFQEEPPEEA